jgi:hypothetical protein
MSVLINASTSTGLVQSADTSGEIELQSNGTTALKVNTNEGIQILNCLGVGNATPSTSGAGITFPATQSASTDANTLDDYEEGTWTPNVGGNATYTIQLGTYVKVGKLVTVNFDMAINAIGTGSQFSIFGFPFTSSNDSFPRTGCVSYYQNLSVSPIWIALYVGNNSTNCVFVWNTAGASTVGNNSANLFTTGSRVICSVSYNASA